MSALRAHFLVVVSTHTGALARNIFVFTHNFFDPTLASLVQVSAQHSTLRPGTMMNTLDQPTPSAPSSPMSVMVGMRSRAVSPSHAAHDAPAVSPSPPAHEPDEAATKTLDRPEEDNSAVILHASRQLELLPQPPPTERNEGRYSFVRCLRALVDTPGVVIWTTVTINKGGRTAEAFGLTSIKTAEKAMHKAGFKTSRFDSLKRQINAYGFKFQIRPEAAATGGGPGLWFHPRGCFGPRGTDDHLVCPRGREGSNSASAYRSTPRSAKKKSSSWVKPRPSAPLTRENSKRNSLPPRKFSPLLGGGEHISDDDNEGEDDNEHGRGTVPKNTTVLHLNTTTGRSGEVRVHLRLGEMASDVTDCSATTVPATDSRQDPYFFPNPAVATFCASNSRTRSYSSYPVEVYDEADALIDDAWWGRGPHSASIGGELCNFAIDGKGEICSDGFGGSTKKRSSSSSSSGSINDASAEDGGFCFKDEVSFFDESLDFFADMIA